MSRLRDTLKALQARGDKAMGLFLTNGFPDPSSTLPILQALDKSGVDFIELGMPFSDPLAEGLPIQRSSSRALAQGVQMDDAFRTVEQFRATSETPLLLMGYVNPIFRYGVSNFCQAARSSGVDGLILPDLPPEESALIAEAAADADLGMVYLIAPNTPDDRIAEIDGLATAFVYAVSVTGLTGAGLGEVDAVASYLARARKGVQHNPLLVGFGIKTHDDAMRLSQHTDGFIVGSALITLIEALWDDTTLTLEDRLSAVRGFVHGLKHGTAPEEVANG
ncbi:MAG TPA: tryptophan synthase subunit alpha [Rhodothermales bacterium]|nr:tryptophan synthase subunit alpha [Rhodothermales bacterium]